MRALRRELVMHPASGIRSLIQNFGESLGISLCPAERDSDLSSRSEVGTGRDLRNGTSGTAQLDMRNGQCGITAEDLLTSIDEEFRALVKILNPRNVKNYIALPQDADVVAVEPVAPSVSAHKYVRQ